MAWRAVRQLQAAATKTACWALVLGVGGCFADPGDLDAETVTSGSTGVSGPGSTSGPSSSSTAPDPSASGGPVTTTGTDPGSTGLTRGVTTEESSSTSSSTSSASATTDQPECGSLEEEFEGALSGDWTYTDMDNVAVGGGALVLTVTADVTDGVNKVELVSAWTGLEGASVTVELGQTPSDVGTAQMIRFTTPGRDPDLVVFRVREEGVGPQLQVWHSVNNMNPQDAFAISFDPTAHRFLRVRQEGDELLFETSEDGGEFSERYSMEDIFELSGAAVAMATTNTVALDEDESVSFESFELVDCVNF